MISILLYLLIIILFHISSNKKNNIDNIKTLHYLNTKFAKFIDDIKGI